MIWMMQSQFVSLLDSFTDQASNLLAQDKQLRVRRKTPSKDPMKDVLGEVGGAIGASLLESSFGRKLGKAITKGIMSDQERYQVSLEEQRLGMSFNALLGGVRSFLSTVSLVRPSLTSAGNSELLLRRLVPAENGMRLDTRIRRLTSILRVLRNEPLIYNTGISAWLEQEKKREVERGEPYQLMKTLETSLRLTTSSKLAQITPNWWIERIPDDVRRRAEERVTKNEKLYPWQSHDDNHPIHFVDFADYVKIICRRDNWDQAFSSTFRDKEIISAKLRELEPIRNAVAHFRNLTKSEALKLDLYSSEILGNTRSS